MAFKTLFPNKSKGKLKKENKEDNGNSDMTLREPNTDSRSFQYSYTSNSSSLFSSKKTMTTGASSQQTSSLSYHKQGASPANSSGFTSVGRSLMVLREDKEDENTLDYTASLGTSAGHMSTGRTRKYKSSFSDDVSLSSNEHSIQSTNSISSGTGELEFIEFTKGKLNQLANSISSILIKVSQSVLSLTKAAISISDAIYMVKNALSQHKYLPLLLPYQFTTSNTIGLRKIIKYSLHLLDNILLGEVYDKSKALIMKNLYDLLLTLKLVSKPPTGQLTNFLTLLNPRLFALGSNNLTSSPESPSSKLVNNIMLSLISKNEESIFNDQEGSFVAPVLRGFQTPDLAVVTFIFGFPELNREHHDVIKFFSRQAEEMHFFGQKNSILPAAVKTPFRTIDDDQQYIPISMSISSDNAMTTSGTFGGYLYPKISGQDSTKFAKYKGQVFGMTCSHVVLSESDINQKDEVNDHPNVSIPSPVLINMYKNALVNELNKFNSCNSPEYQAFNKAVGQIDEMFPQREIQSNDKSHLRNLPRDTFGSIIWGERLVHDNKLSDVAIIKINNNDKKLINYLGDDIQLTKFDPTLIMSNLNIKKVISLTNRNKNGDSFSVPHANIPVFKYGSTTLYTRGTLNGTKLIYWSDGSLRSSEFVINGGDLDTTGSNNDNNARMGFASGGDSGAWILSKLNDINRYKRSHLNSTKYDSGNANVLTSFIESFLPNISRRRPMTSSELEKDDEHDEVDENEMGLGVLGMLHSYDGEFRQFGLFTPMDHILDRLKEITGLEWGIVGCDEANDESHKDDISISSKNSDNNL